MTKFPVVVSPHTTVGEATRIMRELGVRHLPVEDETGLVGIVSERDLVLGAAFTSGLGTSVEKVMTRRPFTVSAETPLSLAIHTMAERKIGSTVVVDAAGKTIGILTCADALNVLFDLLACRGTKSPAQISSQSIDDSGFAR